MAQVTVDVDLNEFDIHEIAEELYDRLDRQHRRSGADEKQLKRFFDLLKALNSQYRDVINLDNIIPSYSLTDQLKQEYLQQVSEKYTLSHIESVLPV